VSGDRRRREWRQLGEKLEAIPSGDAWDGKLHGYQIIRPSQLSVPARRGSTRQLAWAVENWIRPYLSRMHDGIEYDPKLHLMPTEPDWRIDRGRGNVASSLMYPYGDDWQPEWVRKGPEWRAASIKQRAKDKRLAKVRRRASD
jgi:hypothetical protein